MAVLRNPRTGATAHLPEKLVARYLAGGWVVVAPTHPQVAADTMWDRIPPAVGRSVADTLARADGPPLKASAALRFALSRGTPRVTLVNQLKRLAPNPTPTTGEGEEE